MLLQRILEQIKKQKPFLFTDIHKVLDKQTTRKLKKSLKKVEFTAIITLVGLTKVID